MESPPTAAIKRKSSRSLVPTSSLNPSTQPIWSMSTGTTRVSNTTSLGTKSMISKSTPINISKWHSSTQEEEATPTKSPSRESPQASNSASGGTLAAAILSAASAASSAVVLLGSSFFRNWTKTGLTRKMTRISKMLCCELKLEISFHIIDI